MNFATVDSFVNGIGNCIPWKKFLLTNYKNLKEIIEMFKEVMGLRLVLSFSTWYGYELTVDCFIGVEIEKYHLVLMEGKFDFLLGCS